jgi:dihydroflavonol-4-reductase
LWLESVTSGCFEEAKRMPGWPPRSNEESIVATAETLVRLGPLKGSTKTAA